MWTHLASMRDRWGDAPALAVARAAEEAALRVGAFCTEEGVDAWYRQGGYLEVSTAPPQDGAGHAAVEACRELGVADKLQLDLRRRGPHPLRLARVPRRGDRTDRRDRPARPPGARPARGACSSRASRSTSPPPSPASAKRADGVEATTTTGARVRAPRGVLAIGGAARSRRGPLAGRLTVASSHILITEPVPDVIEALGWTGGEAITDGRALVHYFRTTPDGRIAFGWGGGRIAMGARTHGRAEVDADVIEAQRRHLLEYFPALMGRRITHAWGGPIDASPTHLPAITSLKNSRAWVAAGYTGNGVGPTNMIGRTLASLALDLGDDPTRLAFVDGDMPRVPPEPFHWIGGEAIRMGIASEGVRRARREEAEPDRLSSGEGPRPPGLPHRPLAEKPTHVVNA